jgi:hypothetical protein
VGRCGNSGNSSEAHLHLQLQTKPTLGASGQRTIPIEFEHGSRLRRNSIVEPP